MNAPLLHVHRLIKYLLFKKENAALLPPVYKQCSSAGCWDSLPGTGWLFLFFFYSHLLFSCKTCKQQDPWGDVILLKDKPTDFLGCTAAVTPPITVATCKKITRRDKNRAPRLGESVTLLMWRDAQPPSRVEFRGSESFSCQEPCFSPQSSFLIRWMRFLYAGGMMIKADCRHAINTIWWGKKTIIRMIKWCRNRVTFTVNTSDDRPTQQKNIDNRSRGL